MINVSDALDIIEKYYDLKRPYITLDTAIIDKFQYTIIFEYLDGSTCKLVLQYLEARFHEQGKVEPVYVDAQTEFEEHIAALAKLGASIYKQTVMLGAVINDTIKPK